MSFKVNCLISLPAFCLCITLNAQPFIQFQKSFGGSQYDFGLGAIKNSSGGFTIAGSTMSNDGQVSGYHPGNCSGLACPDIWLVNTDSLGNINWEKCYGGTGDDYVYSISPTSDGGSIICGYTESTDGDVANNIGFNSQAAWVFKVDSIGNLQWEKCYGGRDYDAAHNIIQTLDGGYIFCGGSISSDGDLAVSFSPHYGSRNGWVVKIDSVGTIQWTRAYGGSGDDLINTIIQTEDSGFAFIGETISNDLDVSGNNGYIDYWLGRIDPNGVQV